MRRFPRLAIGLAVALALTSVITHPVRARFVSDSTAAAATPSVLVGAGDIAVCGLDSDEATANLVKGISGTVFTAGDNAYPRGGAADYANCYEPSWGAFRDRTRPAPGNHEYETDGAAGYFDYFGTRAGPGGRGYYAYTRGTWRIYSLNSMRITDRQIDWLKADIAAHPSECSLAYWHYPRYSTGFHGNTQEVIRFWRPLYRSGIEFVVNGHDHDYERWKKRRPGGTFAKRGIREFVVGTGGAALRDFVRRQPAKSVVRQATDHGVIKFTLLSDSYRWEFVSADGSFTDTGSSSCHGRP